MTLEGKQKLIAAWARRERPLTAIQRKVIEALGRHAEPVTIMHLEKLTGMSRNSVADVLQKLRSRGLIVKHGFSTGVTYSLLRREEAS
jgi:DNA-binding IclR family transcriptional regulator